MGVSASSGDPIADLLTQHPNLVEQLRNERVVLFAGAGLSRPVGLPSWTELMSPLAQQLGIDPNTDPIQIATYYATSRAQGEHLLQQHIIKELESKSRQFSAGHDFVKNLRVPIILTTNYDTLFEYNFELAPRSPLYTVVQDKDLPHWDGKSRLLVKMNGSIASPFELVATREHFLRYRETRPEIFRKIGSLMADHTFLFIGFSFHDPVFEQLNAEVLRHLPTDRPPFYFLALRSNRYEVDDKRSNAGIEVLDLNAPNTDKPLEVIKFLELLVKAAGGVATPATATPASVPAGSASSPGAEAVNQTDLLAHRLGTGLSMQADPRHVDSTHRYELIYREDLLDYQTLDFVSFRHLVGVNDSEVLSSFLVYSESSEEKVSFDDLGIEAIDFKTKNLLLVQPWDNSVGRAFTQAFKIFFPTPLAPGERFDIAYRITLPGELRTLRDDNEVMSISLARITRPVGRVVFNVCLNFQPKSCVIECIDHQNQRSSPKGPAPRIARYTPKTTLQKRFALAWSSDPWIISWEQNEPTFKLAMINYRR